MFSYSQLTRNCTFIQCLAKVMPTTQFEEYFLINDWFIDGLFAT
jgi:hypothetical protein